MTTDHFQYRTGFGNELETEAVQHALPVGQFNPQRVNFGLYAEQFSTTAFTAPRHLNRRTWFYRIRPSVTQGDYRPLDNHQIINSPYHEVIAPPNLLRWDPRPIPQSPVDFIDGLCTYAVNGAVGVDGVAIHSYVANASMDRRFFHDADGELLLVPQQGRLHLATECGHLMAGPGEIAVIPRGMKFQVRLPDGPVRGYIAENHGSPLTLPERGPVGANGYANDRDFQIPVAAYDDVDGDFEIVTKFKGNLFVCDIDHSPLDVVAWTGNSYPYKYDLSRFNVINTVSFDHPDPSIFTVLTSPSAIGGTANLDFVIFPPRWMVAEHTFRPPWYHRNIMSEFMGLIEGVYDAKEAGFVPGGASLHNSMTPHGPEFNVFEKASSEALSPKRYENTLAFMFESRFVFHPTRYALDCDERQADYINCYSGFKNLFRNEIKKP